MGVVFGSVGLFLFAGSIFVLARASRWGLKSTLVLVFLAFVVPFGLVFVLSIWPAPAWVQETLFGFLSLTPFAVLFALAKTVSARVHAAGLT